MTPSARARLCRWLLALGGLAATWAIAVALTGGFVVRLGGLRVSSRRWQAAAVVALACTLAAWAASTPEERRSAWRRLRDWRHWPSWLDAALLLALAGIGLRLVLWAAGRPFWLDEEMIAINVRGRGVGELSGALWLGQTAPLGWLLLERVLYVAFGGGELALRAAPLAFGIGTIVTALWVGRHWMNRLGSAVLAGLCAFGPWLIYNSVELKPYSADVFWGLLLPILAAWALEPRAEQSSNARASNDRVVHRRVTVWWLAASAGHWFANGALLVTPACALVLVVMARQRGGWPGALRAALPGVLWLASFGLHYALSIRETLGSEFLAGYWAFAMPPASASVTERLTWVAGRLESLAVNPAGSQMWVIFWLVAIAGFVLASPILRGALLAAVPLSAFGLAALRIVPLFERLSIWALPALYVGIALSVDRGFRVARGATASRRWSLSAAAAVLAGAGLSVSGEIGWQGAAQYLRVDLDHYAHDDNHQLDDRAAVRWLLERRRSGDVLITTHLALPAMWWYGDVPVNDAEGGGSRLADGTPIVVVGFAPARAECGGNELRAPLTGHRRALVYLGFRFDDVPQGFDERLLGTLSELGVIVAEERFSAAGRAVIVELSRRVEEPTPAAPRGPATGPGRSGCLTVERARRW